MTSHGFDDFSKFAEATSFAGIIQAHRGSRNSKVFWAVLLVATFSVTWYSVVELVREYSAEETVTISFVRNNDTITHPDPTICLRFNTTDLWGIVERLDLNNISNVRKHLQYLQNHTGEASWLEANAFNATWLKRKEVQSFLTLSTIMFLSLSVIETSAASQLLTSERYVNTITGRSNFTWSISMEWSEMNKYKELSTSVAEVRNFILQNGGDWMKVRENVALTWLMNANVVLYRPYFNATSEIHLDKLKLTWFGGEPFMSPYETYHILDFCICFQIANATTFFTFGLSHGSWLEIRSRRDNLPVQAIDIMFSKDRGPTLANLLQNTATFDRDDYPHRNIFFVGFDQRHVALNLRKEPCLTDMTQFDCKMHCQSKFLQQYCGCLPLSFQWDAPRYADRFCGLAKYSADASVYTDDYSLLHLRQLQSNSKQFVDCFGNCAKDCVTTTLSIEYGNTLKDSLMSAGNMIYTEYNSKMRMSSSDFFANLGGTLGLWNGACMLSYVHCAMWILQWVFYKCFKRIRAIQISDTNKNKQPNADSSMRMHITEFVETTGFVGIAHAYDGKKFQRIVWIVLIIGSQCLALYDVVQQAIYYLRNNAATSVSVENNYGLDLPTPTFCLFPDMQLFMRHAYQFKLTNSSYVQTTLRQYDNVNDVPNFLLKKARDGSFITRHATFIVLATSVFFRSSYIESALSSMLLYPPNSSALNYLREFNACFTTEAERTLADQICHSTLIVKDYIVDHNIDLVQLRNTLTYIWWSQVNVTFHRPDNAGLLQLTNASQIRTSWFGYEPMHYDSYYRICFQLSNNHTYFKLTDNSDYIAATSNPMAPFGHTTILNIPVISLIFTTRRTEQFYSGSLTLPFYFMPPIIQRNVINVQIYKSLSTAERPCSPSTTHLDLMGACVTQFFVENCNCFPFSWLWDGVLTNHAHAPLCGFMVSGNHTNSFLEPAFEQCSSKLTANYDKLRMCVSSCLSACEIYTFYVGERLEQRITTENELYYTEAHQFLTITERVDKSMVDFIADLGGIIGVWNGAIAMTYIHIIVFLVKWLASYCGYKGLQTSITNVPNTTYDESVSAEAVKEFVKTTSFAGVVYAYHSRTWFERVFWSATLCLFFGFTTQNICQQVQQYQEQDTLTETTVATSSDIVLPNPVICLRTQSDWLSFTVRDMNLTDFNKVNKMLAKISNVNVTEWLISKKAKDTWEQKAFLLLATCVLFDLATNETLLVSPLKTLSWSSVCGDVGINKGIFSSLAITNNFLKNRNLDFIAFRHALTATWVQQMKIGIDNITVIVPSLLSHEDFETTWFGPNPFQNVDNVYSLHFSICFRLHDGRRLFRFTDDQESRLWMIYELPASFASGTVSVFISLSFVSARAYSSEATDATVEVGYGGGYYVAVEKKFTFMNLTKNTCKSEGSNYDCKLNCISSLIRKYCGCAPLNYLWDNVDARKEWEQMPLCGLNATTSIASCPLRFPNTSIDAIRTCQQRCPRDCMITTVCVYDDPVGKKYKENYWNMKVVSLPCVEFNEVFRMTAMDYWRNIGGILGVWTGACLLSYVHAAAFIVNLIWLKSQQYNQIQRKNYMDTKSRY